MSRILPSMVVLALVLSGAQPEPRAAARRGVVRLSDRAFADDAGPYLALGHSLFWARWGYVHDRARLERNLKFLADHGVDYIRVLGILDWPDRKIGASAPDDSIGGLTDLAFDKYGLRVEWSIFGGIESAPTPSDRETLVRRFSAALAPRREKVQAIEVGNELWSTGWRDKTAEAQALARLMRQTFSVVAVTSPQGLAPNDVAAWYANSNATLLTVHLPRDGGRAGGAGAWTYVCHAWEPAAASPLPWSNDEGKGPQSSVSADDDPLRLTMYAALTWLGGGAAFTLHTGAGISGGGELAKPGPTHPFTRSANVWEVPHIEETLRAIATVRKLLPPDVPNWKRSSAGAQLYSATAADGRMVAMAILVNTPLRIAPERPLHVDVYDPLTGERIQSGDTPFDLAPRIAAILIGKPR